jgi:hypothetical protein
MPLRRQTDPDAATAAAAVAELVATQREHSRRLDDHDSVLLDIRDHLGKIVEQASQFQTRILVAAALMFGGTEGGQELLRAIAGL